MKNKKKFSIIILMLLIIFGLISAFYIFPAIKIGISQNNSTDTFLLSSESPDGKYVLEAYKTQPGATIDFSIKVYIVNKNDRKIIYNAYHEYKANVSWISNDEVCINGKILNLLNEETYDWRNSENKK